MSTTHRGIAEGLLEALRDSSRGKLPPGAAAEIAAVAQAEATLAQADAIDRLTAAIECMELPALEVSGSVLKGTCRVRPVRR